MRTIMETSLITSFRDSVDEEVKGIVSGYVEAMKEQTLTVQQKLHLLVCLARRHPRAKKNEEYQKALEQVRAELNGN